MDEVFIIGGGFVGLYLSYRLALKSVKTTVFEEHSAIGFPEHCAGLISEIGLERLGLLQKAKREGLIINRIKCAQIYLFGREIKVCLDNQELLVVDRPKLDNLVYRLARDSGSHILLSKRVNSVDKYGNISVEGKTRTAEVVILAEGASRRLLRRIYGGHNVSRLVPTVQADVLTDGYCSLSDVVRIIKLRDYFMWIIPLGGDRCRIGVASKLIKNKVELIKRLARKIGIKKIEKIFGGLVNFSGPLSKFVFSENLAIVGDVAGQNKPISGGGVVLGGLSAALLASVIKRRLEGIASLYDYEKIWWKFFRTNILLMDLVSNILFSSHFEMLNKLLSKIVPPYIKIKRDYDLPLLKIS